MSTASRIDWSQLCYPGPRRPFSADEMRRAGADEPSPTLIAAVLLNGAVVAFVVMLLAPPSLTPRLLGTLVGIAVIGWGGARWLWRRPWRRPLLQASLAYALAFVIASLAVRGAVTQPDERRVLALTVAIGGVLLPILWWFLVVWRAQQISARLAEQTERERAIEMARRLASAQLAPHFLFNTLASLQHWVQTKDDRAAALLDALTGYLRATLPMFARALLPLSDELEAVRRYLQVMQARLGERLHATIEVDAALLTLPLPPALLLTLVENAVEHGIEPRLAGGRVELRGRVDGAEAVIEVRDDGPGPAPDMVEGVGLANSRERLALTHGEAARLSIAAAAQGGCIATLRVPMKGGSA